jgi:hypothetical protein
MSYTTINFPTKKALKQAVADRLAWEERKRGYNPSNLSHFEFSQTIGAVLANKDSFNQEKEPPPVCCYNPVLGPNLVEFTGKVYLEGPHYPKPHRWYAEAWLEDGKVVRVK